LFKFSAADYPLNPGVYLFRNEKDEILYVGKAKKLRQRLASYASGGDGRPNISVMLKHARSLDTIVTHSELEALVLENNLIKEHRPRYNIFFRDDKSYPFIRVTNELFPRVFVTRKVIRDGSRYFGPYTDVKHLRSFLRDMRGKLNIRECALSMTIDSINARKHKLCLDYHLGKCQAPCEALQSPADYQKNVTILETVLQGNAQTMRRAAQDKMKSAAAVLDFEEATNQRDLANLLEQFIVGQRAEKGASEEDLDVAALATDDNDACVALFRIREGRIIGRFHNYLKGAMQQDAGWLMRSFLLQYYTESQQIPPRILLSHKTEDHDLFEQWISERRKDCTPPGKGKFKVRLEWPQRGEKLSLLKMAEANAVMLLSDLQLNRMRRERIPESLKALQRDLNLEKLPKRIEGFDISHFQGKSTVASMVVFQDGKAKKKDYRHFHVKTVSGIDDFASMEEIVRRHYKRVLTEGSDLADLVLIDGGKGQLSRAVFVLQELGLKNLAVIGLAKRLEEVFIPGQSLPLNIPKTSASNRLLQQVRNEAHRFAISFNRQLRRKSNIRDPLSEIKGLGPVLLERLYAELSSKGGLAKATLDDILGIKGISQGLAESIWDHLLRIRINQAES
jgi:excinuclease ABC subunit C